MWRKTEDNCQLSKGMEKCTAEKDIWMKPMKYWAILDQEAVESSIKHSISVCRRKLS